MRPTDDELKQLPLYVFPGSNESKKKNLAVMHVQIGKLIALLGFTKTKVHITCGECGETFPWWYMYRCLYCDIRFCKRCAQLHFGKRLPDNTEKDHDYLGSDAEGVSESQHNDANRCRGIGANSKDSTHTNGNNLCNCG